MGGKKGGDKGVDGATETGVISVKAGGNVNPAMVRDLGRVTARDGHKLGVLVTAKLPTRGMEDEANSHGLVEIETAGRVNEPERFPALQTFTLAELFQDRRPKLPPSSAPTDARPVSKPAPRTRPGHKAHQSKPQPRPDLASGPAPRPGPERGARSARVDGLAPQLTRTITTEPLR